ncbi:hypothetical protein MED121_09875 [Marinomonas sp. MED121]|uniref:hypothetical protein n=1 Tax=Marinomonas sp. MED121 TaxID=314277 RepID=UPI000068FB43|nr:hypothetical protein [Marinomonas sp. MED121]EAQ65019.1 hypothetical protein MED121_09875 [Marinomonas sp. MED121]
MPHSQKLTELKEFKWALWGPLGAAFIVAIVITSADYYSPESLQLFLTSECFNDAIKRHKFSLGVAALVFPLVALVASNHRSIQTVAQIQATEQKNSFENHIKHKEVFKSKIETLSKKYGYEKVDVEELYKAIFVKNSASYFEPYVDINHKTLLNYLDECFINISFSQKENTHLSYLYFLESIFEINKLLSPYYEDSDYRLTNIVLDLGVSKLYLSFSLDLYNEISSFAFNKKSSLRFNKGNKSFIVEIYNFETLAFDEDQGEEDNEDWGEKTYKFGYEFRAYLSSEYNNQKLNLKNIDEYFNTRRDIRLF